MSDNTCTDREALLRAASILDMLAVGWTPGKAELDGARRVERWTVMPGPSGCPYQLVGAVRPQLTHQGALVTSLIAIEPKAHWARIWDEWVVIDTGLTHGAGFEPAEVRRVAGAWLLRELEALSVH